jgi:hypothetical protein
LAGEIRAAHDAATNAMQSAAERGKDAGERLIEAKKLLKHGQWLPFLKEIGLHDRMAARYMELARLDKDKFDMVSNLGLAAALEKVRGTDNDDDEPDDDEEPSAPPEWTDDQLKRKARAEAGECVVANLRKGADEALIAWARETDRLVQIDRTTDWGNPFEMPEDGERAEVVGKFEKFYFPHKGGLLMCVSDLAGKVLGCWCYPEQCHGDVIAAVANEASTSGRDAWEIAEELADHDG